GQRREAAEQPRRSRLEQAARLLPGRDQGSRGRCPRRRASVVDSGALPATRARRRSRGRCARRRGSLHSVSLAGLRFRWCQFAALSATELYEMLALRNEVFVVEQRCPYRDLDFRDQQADHLLARDADGTLVGYVRCLPPDAPSEPASFGRVLVATPARRHKLGRALVKQALA